MRLLDTLIVPAKIEYLYECMDLVSSCAKREGFEKKGLRKIELSTEEALINIFNHAYRDESGDVEISCLIDHETTFVIEIKDYGVPFNMLSVKDPELNLDIDDYNIGGLGIFMIKSLMDDVKYRRETGANILTLVAYKHTQYMVD